MSQSQQVLTRKGIYENVGAGAAFFPGLGVGNKLIVGNDYPWVSNCNHKIEPVSPVVLGGSGAIDFQILNGGVPVSMNVISSDADEPYESLGNAIFTSSSDTQIRWGEPAAWATTTISGETKYVITGAISDAGELDRVKVGPSRVEYNKDSFQESFGKGEKVRRVQSFTGVDLASPSGGTNAPGNFNIAISSNITFQQPRSLYSATQNNRAGRVFNVPQGLDTSRRIRAELRWTTTGTSTNAVRWVLYVAGVREGDSATAGTLTQQSIVQLISPSGVSGEIYETDFDFFLPGLLPGDQIAFSLWREGAVDTNTDPSGVLNISFNGFFWK